MAYDPVLDQVLLYGGLREPDPPKAPTPAPEPNDLFDTWVWTGADWVEKKGAGPELWVEAMAYDSVHHQTLLVGEHAGTLLSETWGWSEGSWQRLQVPNSRYPNNLWSSMAPDPDTAQMLLFGGMNNGGVQSWTWLWNGASWVAQATPDALAYRGSVSVATDRSHHQVLMAGGDRNQTDTWVWSSGRWQQASTTGAYAHSFEIATDNGVLLFDLERRAGHADPLRWDGSAWQPS